MNSEVLLRVLADGQYHSGEALGRALCISRSAVWKQIRGLRGMGLDIQSVKGRGYRLVGGLELLDRQRLESGSDGIPGILRGHLHLHASIDSTNAEAMRLLRQGESRCVVVAEHQSRGRGRRGRSWVSPFGRNIYLSLLWPFERGVAAMEGLSLVCALAVEQALADVGVSGVQLKWPNDVLHDGRKLAGILLEVQGDFSDRCQLVIGVGVNADMTGEAAGAIDQPYSDVKTAAGHGVDRNRLVIGLVQHLARSLERFEEQGFTPFRERWMERDHYLGKDVELHCGQQVLRGRLEGVDESGRLQLYEPETGNVRTVAGGEVFPSLRPAGVKRVTGHDT